MKSKEIGRNRFKPIKLSILKLKKAITFLEDFLRSNILQPLFHGRNITENGPFGELTAKAISHFLHEKATFLALYALQLPGLMNEL